MHGRTLLLWPIMVEFKIWKELRGKASKHANSGLISFTSVYPKHWVGPFVVLWYKNIFRILTSLPIYNHPIVIFRLRFIEIMSNNSFGLLFKCCSKNYMKIFTLPLSESTKYSAKQIYFISLTTLCYIPFNIFEYYVFWDVTPCSVVAEYQHFGEICWSLG